MAHLTGMLWLMSQMMEIKMWMGAPNKEACVMCHKEGASLFPSFAHILWICPEAPATHPALPAYVWSNMKSLQRHLESISSLCSSESQELLTLHHCPYTPCLRVMGNVQSLGNIVTFLCRKEKNLFRQGEPWTSTSCNGFLLLASEHESRNRPIYLIFFYHVPNEWHSDQHKVAT